ncbi:MAG: phenylalanine 4-monooxygenase [Alphaproteobacteria bacterium]
MRPDYTFDFDPAQYTPEDHAMWKRLCTRQKPLLKGRACDEYMESVKDLGIFEADRIPDWREVSDSLTKATGWKLVIVPGFIPGDVFLEHLSKRQFPTTWWIRPPEKMDYLQEPDIFHDLFGHVPMLGHPVFADYMQMFGEGCVKAKTMEAEGYIARLYWFTVEFGLINTPKGLRIYGSGIVSSKTESVYCLESPLPNRFLLDDVCRPMRTDYRIDDVQKDYFVINSFDELFAMTRPDFTPYYEELKKLPLIPAKTILPTDTVLTEGQGATHAA